MTTKPGTPNSVLTKTVIFSWIKQIVPELNPKIKVEDLGTGQLYCRIINHYFPGSITANRINLHPKNEYEYSLNLKMFQNSLTLHRINILFDVGKISKLKFLENWILVNALYKHLVTNAQDTTFNGNDDSKSVSCAPVKYTPKRSFECAFSNQQSHKLSEISNLIKPNFYQQSSQVSNFTNQQSIHMSQPNQTFHQGSQHNMTSGLQHNMNNGLQQNINSNYIKNDYQAMNVHGVISSQNLNQNMELNLQVNQPLSTNHQNKSYQNNQMNSFNNLNNTSNNSFNTISSFYNNLYKPTINHQIMNQNRLNSQQGKCYSVGKLPTSSNSHFSQQGKYSVNSHIFQNNYNAIIDRVKQILLKASHDVEKIRQIKMLLNIPLNDGIVKIQQEDNCMMTIIKPNYNDKQNINILQKSKQNEKQLIKPNTSNISSPAEASSILQKSRQLSNISHKIENDSNRQSISSNQSNLKKSVTEFVMKKQGLQNSFINKQGLQNSHKKQLSSLKIPQSSGKKIKNNFFGEGSVFRK